MQQTSCWKVDTSMAFYKERRSIAMKLGINGLGRIGKLSLWHHVSRKHFSEIVVNVGREVGCGLDDLASMIERDSTYGRLGAYLFGHKCPQVIEELNEKDGTMVVNGIPVSILRSARNPFADLLTTLPGFIRSRQYLHLER